jgi:dihydrodipicolinate synthase/N-acetylneuraminate lyase
LRVTRDDIRGVMAIIPTPATAEAGDPAAMATVDVGETERAVRALVAAGVGGILTNGTCGEGATLLLEEWMEFIQAVVRAAGHRVPVFVGTTTLNTRETIRRSRLAREVGAEGILLGRPMWCEMDDATAVGYYRAVAAAVPELGIVVYDNPEAFKGKLSPRVYGALAEVPQVVAAKYIFVGPQYRADLAASRGRIRLLPLDVDWYWAWRWAPTEAVACWSGSAACGPEPVVALADALGQGDEARAAAITREIEATYETFLPEHDFHLFSRYNIPLEKLRIDAAGFMRAGPCRPPYGPVPEAYAAGAREAGRRWRVLRARYTGQRPVERAE